MTNTSGTLTEFTAGDLVISISGDTTGGDAYGDNAASPVTLEELTTTGTVVGTMVLPQVTTVQNGVTQYAISSEFGSSSEGSLQLSADGQSLVIMGYGINAAMFNAGGAGVYGTTALAQSTSVPGGTDTAVPRVIADIGYNGTVDTSTALYNVFNTNNPRSVATVNGTVFYISGQGVKGDTTQGVFVAHDGANSATAINTSADTRTAEIYNGELYISRDSTQAGGGSIETFGTALPTGAATGTVLPGIDLTVTVTAANANSVNAGMVGKVVELSPENYFFASPTVLYIADGGIPKEGGAGDGGLQKWVLTDGTWTLEYTLSDGLNLVQNTATAGTTGLIGLTGTVIGNTVELFATNATINDLDPTFLFGITDTLTATSGTGETFTTLASGIPGSDNIRGVSFAPSADNVAPTSVTVSSDVTSTGLTVTSGGSITILNGGTAVSTTVLSGGTELVSAGGVDSGSDIGLGGNETVLGSASGDTIGGIQLVSSGTAIVSNEIVVNGGSVDLFVKGVIANNTTVETGGTLNINGAATAYATVLDGGQLNLQSPKASFGSSLTFEGASTIDVTAVSSAGNGGLGVISGWGAGDVIDETVISSGATLSTTTSGGNTVATITSGSVVESFIFAGTAVASTLQLVSDGGSGVEISYLAPTSTDIVVSNGVTSSGLNIFSNGSVDVLNGGTLVDATFLSGGSGTIEQGGTDLGSTISGGGFELVLGTATNDQVYGIQLVSNGVAVVNNETIFNGGSVDLFLKGAVANNLVVSSGGELNINGNATAFATVLSNGGIIDLQSPKATLGGTLTFDGTGTLEITDTISAGFGDLAVISGFGSGAVIDVTSIPVGATLSTVVSGGNTVATITGADTETFIFAGTSFASGLILTSDTTGGVEIVAGSSTSSGITPPSSNTIVVSGGTTSSGLTISSGETIEVLSGGTAVAITLLPGAVETVEAGGFDSGTFISSGGSETVAGSATQDKVAGRQSVTGVVVSEAILAGGSATIAFGATDSGSVISAGGNETVIGSANLDQVYGTQLVSAATAIVSNETVFAGGSVDLFLKGAVASALTVESGGALNISGNATAENTVINGGLVEFQSPKAVLSGSLTFSGGGTLEVTSNTSAGFGDLAVISGFGTGDVIDMTSATSVGAAGSGATLGTTTSGGDTFATVTGGGTSDSFIFDGTTIGASLVLGSDGNGGEMLTEVACFLPGTYILTRQGEVLVEQLQVDDTVVTASGRERRLCWIGQGRALATRGRRGAATPLIVRKGALADNVPHRDLHITKGHSLYLDDVLIPVEFLVNHRTILWDDHAQEVTVYHLELDAHDVLVANGAPAESYRDDGNRWLFQNANTGWNQPPKPACAPVLTGGPIVDAVWTRLLDRAGPNGSVPLTDEPDLHLLVDGRRVDATHRQGNVYVFGLTSRPEDVRIVSRSVVPQELGLARDPRSLGVALRQIVVRQGSGFRIAKAKDARLVSGFHSLEANGDFVWTDGEAVLPMDLLTGFAGPVEVVLTTAGTTRYIDDGEALRVA
ncbi:Hint domain-containing protein [Acidisphaera sp. S103]|uniref:Hint domain-containing protein n=1 Tax=Acidisphaera sp. S103 TaxID=1747223 RepID=UPI00131AE2A3|nr:Hint domain-containing protein [Acidisphaera sp. S103]